MNKFLAKFALLATMCIPLEAQTPAHCMCEVVNKFTLEISPGNCNLPGQGSVPCFTVVLGTIPNSTPPESGVCSHVIEEVTICGPLTNCSFRTVRVVITPTACSSACLGATCRILQLDGNPTGMSVCEGASNFNVDVGPPPNMASACGTNDKERALTVHAANGALIMKAVFTFGCHQCASLLGDG